MAYTPIKYIQSISKQHINTGYYANNKTKVEMHFRNDIPEDNSYFFGGRNAWNKKDYGALYEDVYGFAYTDAVWSEISNIEDVLLITEVPQITVNGTTYIGNTINDYVCEYPMFIFGMNNAGTAYKRASISLYYMKIWDDGTLAFDLIPVLDENNVACLYNKVTGTYLYNAGTGDFVAGNPIVTPKITIGTPSRTKISSVTGYDQAAVTFQSDVALQSWEARATTEGQTPGHGSGLLVESGGNLAANTDATVYVDDEELTNGDMKYTITVFGHGANGYWSDGTYEVINILDMTDENIVYLDEYVSYSNNVLTIDTGTLNTDINGYAMKVQILKDDWSYYEQLMYDKGTGTKSVNITKTSSFTTIRVALNGDVVDAAFSIDADALLQNGDSYVLSFDVLEISMNRAVLSNISLVKAVV